MHAFHGNLLAWNILVAARASREPNAILSVAFPLHAGQRARSSIRGKPFSEIEQSGQRRLSLALPMAECAVAPPTVTVAILRPSARDLARPGQLTLTPFSPLLIVPDTFIRI
jgi:hypothetical protein